MRFRLFFREEILNLFVGNDLGLECVSAGLFGFNHLNTLGKRFTSAGFECCDYFLCHDSTLFDFAVNGYSFQDRVVLLAFHPVGGVLFVLGGDVARHARHPALFLFDALEDHLHPVTFFCHDVSGLLINTLSGVRQLPSGQLTDLFC